MDSKSVLKHIKVGQLLPPQLADDGDFAGNTYFDTQGLSGVLVLMNIGTIDAAIGSTAEGTAVTLEECDTTDGSYTEISSAVLSAAIPATDDNKLFGIHVDLSKSHKRYLEIKAPHAGNGTTGANMGAVAIGFPADVMPNSAGEMGLEELIQA